MSLKLCVTIVVISIAAAACSRTGEQAARGFASAGDRYMASGRYSAAVIEYRNAIKRQPTWAEAHARLAAAFDAIGKADEAYREYSNAIDLDAGDVTSRLAAGRLLFDARMYQEARIRAEQVIDRQPKNEEALVLLARAYAAEAVATGDRAGAEAVLRGAIAQVPGSIDAHVALANFFATTGRPAEAEREFLATAAAQPSSELANRSLASFYTTNGKVRAAEPYLKAAAAVDHQRYESSLALADYYTATRRFQEARPVLERATHDVSQAVAARVRLAAIEEESGSHQTARQMLDAILKKNHTPEAMALDAQMRLRDNDVAAAWQSARAALDQDPHLPAANYVAGTIELGRGNLDAAEHDFLEARTSSRLTAAANLQLARTKLAAGRPADAIAFATAAGPAYDARLTLARALVGDGQESAARAELARLQAANPRSADPVILLARLDLDRGDFPAARQEATRALAVVPDSPDALVIAGQAALALNDTASAEQFLSTAVARTASFDATTMLAQVYVMRGELPRAQKMFEDLSRAHPDASAPRTATGIILEAAGRQNEARLAYEQAIALDPNDAVASFNLARLYTNDPAKIESAIALARTAASAAPAEPDVHDALGWAYFKKGDLQSAADEIARAVTLNPQEGSYRQHLAEVRRALDAEAREASVKRTAM
jgi:tetratricopeptide (TPR) repeat protein